MKKFLTVLLGAFIILFNNISVANSNDITKTREPDEKISVKYEVETNNEKQEVSEEQEAANSNETYTDEYVEEITAGNETSVVEEYIDQNVQNTITYGTYGRLYVSWYDVALYDYNVYTRSSSSLQELVDNYDSAAFYRSYGKLVIADHDTQGFSVLTSLSEGSTAYIQFEDGSTIWYRLIRKEKGYNTGPDLIDTAGNSFFNMDSDLIMYTCYDSGIMVTLWSLM